MRDLTDSSMPPFGQPEWDDAVDEDLASEDGPRRFVCDSLAKAEWCARHLRKLDAEKREVQAAFDAWRAELTAWKEHRDAALDRDLAFFEGHLARFGLAERDRTGTATTTLPSAVIKTREAPARVTSEDDSLVIAWAKTEFDPDLAGDNPDKADAIQAERDEIVKVKESLLLTGLRKHVEMEQVATGRTELTLSCGCSVVDADDRAGDEKVYRCTNHGEVAVVKAEPEVTLMASYHGTPVPGCSVEPLHIDVTVVPVR